MKTLLLIHSLFYIANGLWPIIHYRSFEKVTGPKTDKWLVISVGWMITASGLTLLTAFFRNAELSEVFVLAVTNTLFLAMIDIYYVVKKIIARIYLLDAGAEILLLLSWILIFVFHY